MSKNFSLTNSPAFRSPVCRDSVFLPRVSLRQVFYCRDFFLLLTVRHFVFSLQRLFVVIKYMVFSYLHIAQYVL
ncbi:MAG: hypothetical protein [Inoviridae sp.]|nr:MAG: hypothetical protein [Inoviridae sp.]